VAFDEVLLEINMFGFVAHHCVLGVRYDALVVFPYGGGVGDWDALDLAAEQSADVNGLAFCVSHFALAE
jgi:hypothetical protein